MPSLFFQTSTTADGNMSPLIGDTSESFGNQNQWLKSIGVNPDDLCLMLCDHSDKITLIKRNNFAVGMRPETEVSITNEPRIALGLLTADCIPAVFYDPVQKVIALAHLNRKTIAYDLAKQTIDRMTAGFKVSPADVQVYFEPHIHAESYKFKLPLNDPTPPQLAPYMVEKNGFVEIDFAAAHIAQLIEAGITQNNIIVSSANVGKDDNYFSHHASKQNSDRLIGRHLTVAILKG